MQHEAITQFIDARLATRPDPLRVLYTTAPLMRELQYISINMDTLEPLSAALQIRIQEKHLLTENQFGVEHPTPQAILFIDTVNFSFWPSEGEKKWRVEYPQGIMSDGWDGLCTAFRRAVDEGIPIFDPAYLKDIPLDDVRHIFRGKDGTTIPLLVERHAFLQETARVLIKRFGGNAENLLKEATYDAAGIAHLLVDYFPSFRDISVWKGNEVFLLKRAQIYPYDASLVLGSPIHGTEKLTIFPDYKLPQILRHHNVLVYDRSLAKRVDSKQEIPRDSQEELEIRVATIWICEMLAAKLGKPAVMIDNALWVLVARDRNSNQDMKPYHRTRTTTN